MNAIRKYRKDYPVFGDMMANLFNDDFLFPITRNEDANRFTPSVNVKESETKYSIELAAPGFNKKDMNIDVTENMLTISGHIEENTEESEDKFTRREFVFGSFSRSFTLPENANEKAIQASYQNGILTVNIPKKEEKSKEMRTIKIS